MEAESDPPLSSSPVDFVLVPSKNTSKPKKNHYNPQLYVGVVQVQVTLKKDVFNPITVHESPSLDRRLWFSHLKQINVG